MKKKLVKEIVELMNDHYTALCPPPRDELAKEIIEMVERNLAKRAADKATCSTKYHLALAEKGDTRCGVCGQPLRR